MKKVQVILVSQARPKRPARLFLMERVRNGGGSIFSIFLALFPPPLPSQKKGGNIARIAKLPYLLNVRIVENVFCRKEGRKKGNKKIRK